MATLKISDLSVGDWVDVKWKGDDKWKGQIRETSCTGRLEARLLDDIPFKVRCTIEFVEPIPITPEILEANGFEEDCGVWYNSEVRMEFERYKDSWCRTVNCGEYSVYSIKYVPSSSTPYALQGSTKKLTYNSLWQQITQNAR